MLKLKLLFLVLLSLSLGACAAASMPASGFATPITNRVASRDTGQGDEGAATVQPGDGLRVVLVPSELVVGPNRFAVGLFDTKGSLIRDATAHFKYYDLADPKSPRLESEGDAVRLQTPDGLTTIYEQERSFDRAGRWGVEVDARSPEGRTLIARIGFQVLAQSPTLKVGQQVPLIDTATAAQVNGDYKKLTSAVEPDPAFYNLSLAQAVTSGKPTLLLLATPSFCQSRLCGPDYETAAALQNQLGDRLNYVHVEVYSGLPDPSTSNWQLAPAMQKLGLTTEPWLFLIDSSGKVAYRVEGLFTADEVLTHIQAVLNSSGTR